MSSCNIKEFNKRKNKNNLWNESLKGGIMGSNLVKNNFESNNIFGKFNLEEEIVEHDH
jgi:hypothetical protein